MTKDDIILMAREAGFRAGHIELYGSDPMPFVTPASATDCMPELVRFAAIVAAAEREACKQACEGLRGTVSMFATSKDCRLHNNAITCCVQAIRARGESDAP